MIDLKTGPEIEIIRAGGRILADILARLAAEAKPGVTTGELEALAQKLMRAAGGEPAFQGYRPEGSRTAFPTAICSSLNDEVVHGMALPSRPVASGDLLKLDVGLKYRGFFTDTALTVAVGEVAPERLKLLEATRASLNIGLKQVRPGAWVSDIGKAIDRHVRRLGYSTVKDLTGHGVGRAVHEEPPIPNYFDRSLEPVRLVPGMVIAIEPMVNAGRDEVRVKRDGWTIATADGQPSAHFEVTVAVTAKGLEILTPQEGIGLEF
ncbi:MAG: type I methionyl aminopeptidase [Patescibacteria group bacterium]|jgi:methionyl aminopeptidase